jgi:hypothetical protein
LRILRRADRIARTIPVSANNAARPPAALVLVAARVRGWRRTRRFKAVADGRWEIVLDAVGALI